MPSLSQVSRISAGRSSQRSCGVPKLGPEVTNGLIYRRNGVLTPHTHLAVARACRREAPSSRPCRRRADARTATASRPAASRTGRSRRWARQVPPRGNRRSGRGRRSADSPLRRLPRGQRPLRVCAQQQPEQPAVRRGHEPAFHALVAAGFEQLLDRTVRANCRQPEFHDVAGRCFALAQRVAAHGRRNAGVTRRAR